MSRSGYVDDYIEDYWAHIRWRGAVASAIRGKRGQALLVELRDALDAMPVKRLIANDLVTEEGEVCALGAVAKARGADVSSLDPEDYVAVGKAFDVASPLVREIVWINDETGSCSVTPEQRWQEVRNWVEKQIKEPASQPSQDSVVKEDVRG